MYKAGRTFLSFRAIILAKGFEKVLSFTSFNLSLFKFYHDFNLLISNNLVLVWAK